MPGGVFLMRDEGVLEAMKESPYSSEDLLQRLLADHHALLPGDQIDPSTPRRWLLISREVPVPSEVEGSGRWALDHLFLDQDGVPTLVEVKRSSNSEIRRKVVGQMLDYAANAQAYWPVESIQEWLEKTCAAQGRDIEEALRELVGENADSPAFWQTVKTNLRAGRIRLLFVADEIPAELRRIVEFLNEQMDPAEVLAIEIRQYVRDNAKVLVPRVFGHTAKAVVSSGESARWDPDRFFEKLEGSRPPGEVSAARELLHWGTTGDKFVYWGKGSQTGVFVPQISHASRYYQFFHVATGGKVYIPFGAY